MKIAGIEFPSPLLSALRDGRLVVFAGAGVSRGEPANLPDFNELALKIASGTGEPFRDQESEDRFLGRLQHKEVNIYSRTVQVLSCGNPKTTELHRNLMRLFSDMKQVRIVTTNFDLLFEQAAKEVFGQDPEVYRAPALPLGRNFIGIIHIHGMVTHPCEMVLTDADFGRAYLTEGWSRRFLVDLFRYYTVLFIGYSHNDTIMNYLSRALPESEMGKRFILTEENNNSKQWDVLGIMPITFPKPCSTDFSALYNGVQHLADIVRRSVLDWQREITTLAEKLPPLVEEDIGMIEDALTDVVRTRFFVNAARLPEWLIWLDKRKHFDSLFSINPVIKYINQAA
jgi:hypothetical protein